MNLILERLKQLKRIDHSIERFIIEKVEVEDLRDWGRAPAHEQKMTFSVLCEVPRERFINQIIP